MLRVLFVGFIISAVFSDQNSLVSYEITKDVDPMIVGVSVSDEHKRLWKLKSIRYKKCGLCGEEAQPFPEH